MPTIYRSTDSGAPVLSGSLGALVGVLDACLVNGYGSKSPAGWSIAFTDTDKRVYRPPAGTPRHYFYVKDDYTVRAIIQAYKLATGVGVGEGLYPTVSCGMVKSDSANTSIRHWLVAADDRSLIVLVNLANEAATTFRGCLHLFGEFLSLKANDQWRSYCGGDNFGGSILAPNRGGVLYVARNHTGMGSPVPMNISGHMGYGQHVYASSSDWLSANWPIPNPADGKIHMSRVIIDQSPYTGTPAGSAGLRGYVRGLWGVEHTGFSTSLSDLTDVDGEGVYAGRNFLMVQVRSVYKTAFLALETTPWDTN
jgi:hypothetical protein